MDVDLFLIEHLLGISSGKLQKRQVRVQHTVEITSWFYRLGNARKPDKFETVISVYTTSREGPIIGAYLIFNRETNQPLPPSLNPGNKMAYINYGWDQIPHALDLLSALGQKRVYLVYLEFEGGHVWAELQHERRP